MKFNYKPFALLAASALFLSGCSTGPRTFASVNELRVAFVNAGGSCLEWDQTDQVAAALESGTCNSNTVLSIYDSAEAAEESARGLADMIAGYGLTPSITFGGNWVVNSDDATLVSESLGGTDLSE
jgi:hypothetical protein